MYSPQFRTEFDPHYGEAVGLAPNIQRITANNASPFTFLGTNTYLVGNRQVAVIDPGPADDEVHFQAILKALSGRELSHIIVTHTHMDHSPLSQRLKQETGALIYGEGVHRPSRSLRIGEDYHLDASGDRDFVPDREIGHSEIIEGEGWALEAIFTPGHCANHMAFALKDSDFLFSGDHVMAWSTTVVVPPDGSMTDYMASLDLLSTRPETVYLPGHGGKLNNAPKFVSALRTHRKMRESSILSRIRKGDETIEQIVEVIYRNTDQRLHKAAAFSTLAHIEDLVVRGLVQCDGPPSLDGRYTATE